MVDYFTGKTIKVVPSGPVTQPISYAYICRSDKKALSFENFILIFYWYEYSEKQAAILLRHKIKIQILTDRASRNYIKSALL